MTKSASAAVVLMSAVGDLPTNGTTPISFITKMNRKSEMMNGTNATPFLPKIVST